MKKQLSASCHGFLRTIIFLSFLLPFSLLYAGDGEYAPGTEEAEHLVEIGPGEAEDADPPQIENFADEDEKLTINLRRVSLEDFFALIAEKTGLRFLVKPEIQEIEVTVFLPEVRALNALEAMLQVYSLEAREVEPGILLIDIKPEEPFEPTIDMEVELITLRYLDADDVKETIEPFLSQYGKLEVVKRSGYMGWEDARRASDERRRSVESRTLIIRERPEVLKRIRPIVENMDVRPDQVLISAHIIEARHDDIRDIGFDWEISRGDLIGALDLDAWTEPADTEPGLGLNFLRVDGRKRGELEAFFRILEERADANILSSPRLLTEDSQECRILVGERFPILLTDIDPETGRRTTSLDYYEEVGVELNVLPRIRHGNTINMVIRPVISIDTRVVEARDERGAVLASYPVIDTRETETQVSIEDGQTIVIGGLIKEEKIDTVRGVPMLKDIPLMGRLFRRDTSTTEKIDLLVFLSADIIREPGEATEARVRKMGEGIVRVHENRITLGTYPRQGGTASDLTDAAPYNKGEKARLQARPNEGYRFIKWTGNTDLIAAGSSTDRNITVEMRGKDAWFTANFEPLSQ